MVPVTREATYAPTNAAVEMTLVFDRKDVSLVSPALVTLTEVITMIQVTIPHNHTYTLNSCVAVVRFQVITPEPAANAEQVPHAQVLLMNNHTLECEHNLTQLFNEQTETNAKRCYPTPVTCNDSKQLKKIERRNIDETFILRGKEQLNPTKADVQRKKLLSKFNWNESLLNENEKTRLEHFLKKYHSVFARHWF